MTVIDLYEVRRQRGGVVYDGGRRWSGPGPGHSRNDASLSVVIADSGRALVHSFAGDPFRDCAAYLGLPDARPASRAEAAREAARRKAERQRADAEARAFCAHVWRGSRSLAGTKGELYLFYRSLEYEGAELRWHPAAPRSRTPGGPTHPAMIGLVTDAGGRGTGLHVTFIDERGAKAFGARSRLMFGRCAGGAVRLHEPRGGILAVGEGIETSLAFSALKGVPAWAALSTSGLRSFTPPAGITRLLIAADNDDGGAGMDAARALAERARRGCDVEIRPAPAGQDWADVVKARHV